MLNNFGPDRPTIRRNKWLNNNDADDLKQTDDEKQSSNNQRNRASINKASINKPSVHLDSTIGAKYTSEESVQLLRDIANTNVSKKEMDKIIGFETSYKIPIRSYMWDILGLLRGNNRELSQNTDAYIKWLPCAGGIFENYFRYGTDMSALSKDHKKPKSQQIKSLLNCAKHEYRNELSPIVLPNEVSFKIDGIWEVDVRIFRAINLVLQKMSFKATKCQIHISIWSNGPQEQTRFMYPNTEQKTDDNDDIDSEDDVEYATLDEEDINEEILNIDNHCSNIDIEDLMNWNHKTRNVIKVDRRKITETHDITTDDMDDIDDISSKYEMIEVFVERIIQTAAVPRYGDAVMILFDTTKAPQLRAYIWRETLKKEEEQDINIGDYRIKSKANKKRRYFELDAQSGAGNSTHKVNVGQYVGMDIFLHSANSVHQFWTIFNTEIRFEESHVTELWRDYYVNETVFEVAADLDDEYDEYQDNDMNKRKLYETYYTKTFIDKLNDKNAIFHERELLLHKETFYSCLDNKIPPLDKYKPFQFHWKRAQYAKFYGSEFIRRLNDKKTKFNYGELHEKKQVDISNEKAPDLDKYGPFRFHWKRAKIVNDLERDLKVNRIFDLNPQNFKQLYSDATRETDGWEEHKGDGK